MNLVVNDIIFMFSLIIGNFHRSGVHNLDITNVNDLTFVHELDDINVRYFTFVHNWGYINVNDITSVGNIG